jgi:hypothetical protein
VTWRALLGDYPAARALRDGRVTSDVAIHTACAQHLLPRELAVSDLFA